MSPLPCETHKGDVCLLPSWRVTQVVLNRQAAVSSRLVSLFNACAWPSICMLRGLVCSFDVPGCPCGSPDTVNNLSMCHHTCSPYMPTDRRILFFWLSCHLPKHIRPNCAIYLLGSVHKKCIHDLLEKTPERLHGIDVARRGSW